MWLLDTIEQICGFDCGYKTVFAQCAVNATSFVDVPLYILVALSSGTLVCSHNTGGANDVLHYVGYKNAKALIPIIIKFMDKNKTT